MFIKSNSSCFKIIMTKRWFKYLKRDKNWQVTIHNHLCSIKRNCVKLQKVYSEKFAIE